MYYKSRIEEVNYQEMVGKIVPVDSIIAYLGAIGGKLRQSLSQLPDRLAPRLSHESDETTIHALMMKEVRDVTTEIESMFSADGAMEEIHKIRAKRPYLRSKKVISDPKS